MKKKITTIVIAFILLISCNCVYVLADNTDTAENVQVDQKIESFSYYATSCMKEGVTYSPNEEYIVFNTDGSGMVVYDKCAYSIKWSSDGTSLNFTDSMDNELTGTLSDDTLTATFHDYDYVYTVGDTAPIMSLSPDTWNNGLPLVMDQAGILNPDEVTKISEEAKRISEKYSCNVYVVTVDDMNKFSLSNSVETCAEEIQTGYSLGFGDDKDCIMLLLSMADRDYDLCAYGDFGNASFTDYGKSVLEKRFLDNFKKDDWYGGFSDYLSKSDELLAMSAEGTPLDTDTIPVNPIISILVSLLIGFAIAYAICKAIKGTMKSVKYQKSAEEYIADGGVTISYSSDKFVRTTESRVRDTSSNSGSGNNGRSSGGTTTSASGHSHSSGKF